MSAGDASGKSNPSSVSATPTSKPPRLARRSDPVKITGNGDMGSALRRVYQRTVEEAIPDEMMDLLSKLD